MVDLKVGDTVDLKLYSSSIVSPYLAYDEVRTFQIIAADQYGYYLYVPEYYNLKEALRVSRQNCREFGIDLRFLDDLYTYINANRVFKVNTILDGMFCANCEEYFDMASPNQEDGTLICFSCRLNPYR